MPKPVFFILTLLVCIGANGQSKNAVEFSAIARYDRHASYTSNFAARAYNDQLKLFGMSYSAGAAYRRMLPKDFSAYLGVNYYRLRIGKIKGSMPFGMPGISSSRSIENPDDDSTKIGYGTTKYQYNNLAFTLGFNKLVLQEKDFKVEIGVEGTGYHNLSQRYRLGNYVLRTRYSRPMQFGINATAGIIKEFSKFYLRPSLIIPVYQNIKGDRLFTEDANMNIGKWFNGLGLAIQVGKYF